MNNILKTWNWKYEIFFNPEIKKTVDSFEDKLPTNEKDLFKKQKDFYLSFYTMDLLLEAMDNEDLDKDVTIKKALDSLNYCNKLDYRLYDLFVTEIKENYSDYEKDLLEILNHSKKTNYQINFDNYLLDNINEKDYLKVKEKVNQVSQLEFLEDHEEAELLTDNNMVDLYEKTMGKLSENIELHQFFGKPIKSEFDIVVKKSSGYGEWWDKNLYDEYLNDTLVLYENNEISKNDFIYTIIHEVYPGHGYFFKKVMENNQVFDTGAFLLVEGYATYVETNSVKSAYSNNLKIRYAKILKSVFQNNYNDLPNSLIRELNQKIGHIESYYFGSFLIEHLIESKFKNVSNFLVFLSNNTKGDFYKLW